MYVSPTWGPDLGFFRSRLYPSLIGLLFDLTKATIASTHHTDLLIFSKPSLKFHTITLILQTILYRVILLGIDDRNKQSMIFLER